MKASVAVIIEPDDPVKIRSQVGRVQQIQAFICDGRTEGTKGDKDTEKCEHQMLLHERSLLHSIDYTFSARSFQISQKVVEYFT